MEERAPPDARSDEPPSELVPALRSGTYLVQVPKDQIYRIPPPENALIAERHRNPTHKSSHRSILLWIFIIVVILILLLIICAVIFYVVLKPKNPKFFVEHVIVKNPHSHHQHPKYDIALKTENPNAGMGFFYQKGGSALLSFKDLEIANGESPAFYQRYKDSKVFQLVLAGSNVVLPHEIQKSMKGQSTEVSISLLLSVHVPVKMKIGVLQTWTMNMAISCYLRVNTLGKGTRVLSQECHAKV